jgi:hypothetical protein
MTEKKPPRVDNVRVLELAAVAASGKLTITQARKEAGVSDETMSLACLIVARATPTEIKKLKAGEYSIRAVGLLIRKGVGVDERGLIIGAPLRARKEKVREEAGMYQSVKQALLLLTGLPRPKDVAVATLRLNKRNDDVERTLPHAIEWLKEFDREFKRAKAA